MLGVGVVWQCPISKKLMESPVEVDCDNQHVFDQVGRAAACMDWLGPPPTYLPEACHGRGERRQPE